MRLPHFFQCLVPLAVITLLLRAGLGAQETVLGPPIELPKYQVTSERELPPPEDWTYARLEGLEVLSNAPAPATQQLLVDFQRFGYALNLIWPGMRPAGASTASLIICGQKQKFEEFLPDQLRQTERATTSFHLRTRDQAAIVLDYQTKTLNLAGLEDQTGTPASGDSSAEPAETASLLELAVDPYQQLYREYLRFLLAARPVPPPAWLGEGLSQLFMNMRITETEISVGRVENPSLVRDRGTGGPAGDQDFNAALARRALLPMPELFAVARDSATAQNPLNNTWAKQAYAFVHWGLYGDYGRNKIAFATFVARLEREPPGEALFKECFKQSYHDMLFTLRSYIELTRTQFEGVRADKGQKIPFPTDPVVRPATEAEIGRLKGDALILAGHPVKARTVLVDAYRRGERDPNLLAALGLAELAADETALARKFLEAAAAAKAIRPRAYVELARLRLIDAQARPEAAGGKLNAAQVIHALEPLRVARSQPPALPETYQLIGSIWQASATPPPAAQLLLLEEGVRLFPRDSALVYQAAEWRALGGFGSEARALINHGLRVTEDPTMRARFEKLLVGLPPGEPGPKPAPVAKP